jgi:hypothetical protein
MIYRSKLEYSNIGAQKMKLQEIFDHLISGELSLIEYSGFEGNTSIQTEDYFRIIPHINIALVAIYKRLPVKVNSVTLDLQSNLSLYKLDAKYAQSNISSTEPIKYISDSTMYPFIGDVLKVERVENEVGVELPLNNRDNALSVFTPTYNVIEHPYPITGNTIHVTYRASHPKIDINSSNLPDLELELPDMLLEPLLMYIGSRLSVGLSGDTVNGEKERYLAKFEAACVSIERNSLLHRENFDNVKLEMNGWV